MTTGTFIEQLEETKFPARQTPGPVTRERLRRTLLIYLTAVLAGLLPVVLGASAGWQAAGLGLWLPGAGFIAWGGWAVLLFPLTLVAFLFSIIAWFWAGMVVAPVTVWLGSALLAGLFAPETVASHSQTVAAVLIVMAAAYTLWAIRAKHARDEATARRRSELLPASLATVREMVATVPDLSKQEMTAEQLASLRYVLDRALQPVESFEGFDIIDQFQPAALRYQLNHLGFTLGVSQGVYTPNFRGYMHQAQQNLIEKYLLRRVWGYWVYESCWGHLNFTNFDPAGRDNIMLTGWFGMHVGQYMLNSGDRRYAEPGSLTFRLNSRTSYQHDFHSIVDSVVRNYEHYKNDFCLYPCEPNWMYPICNHYGMTALAAHDRLYSTGYQAQILPRWLEKLDAEFTDRSGSIIGLRSKLTGIELPFAVAGHGYAHFANCFAPQRGQQLWAIARNELAPAIRTDSNGQPRITLDGRRIDFGNYRVGLAYDYSTIMVAAREFGDEELASAAQNSLDLDCSPLDSGGSHCYLGGSNLANANIAMARLMNTGDFRRSFVEGPSAASLAGPYLSGIDYPDILVARAYSSGEDLELVLYPGHTPGMKSLQVENLMPGRQYEVVGIERRMVVADDLGRCHLNFPGRQRTEIKLIPVS